MEKKIPAEDFLHLVWKFGLYQPAALRTTCGKSVQIINRGIYNRLSGPDFSHAILKIGDKQWIGNVEIHCKSSDWFKHKHDSDPAYNSVILHVVYEADTEVKLQDGTTPMQLILGGFIYQTPLIRYTLLLENIHHIPCLPLLHQIPKPLRSAFLERMLIERLEGRHDDLMEVIGRSDWDHGFYRSLFKSFGFGANKYGFEALFDSIPAEVFRKVRQDRQAFEALVFGQSGLLAESPRSDYESHLLKEYAYLKRKFRLKPIDPTVWKFMRMRPPNFPTVRLAQLSAVVTATPNLLPATMEETDFKILWGYFKKQTDPFWNTHFTFKESNSIEHSSILGDPSIESILINAILPFRFAYHKHLGHEADVEKTLHFYGLLTAENNQVTRAYKPSGWIPENSSESQGFLHLFDKYCFVKQCLSCNIGQYLLCKQPEKHAKNTL